MAVEKLQLESARIARYSLTVFFPWLHHLIYTCRTWGPHQSYAQISHRDLVAAPHVHRYFKAFLAQKSRTNQAQPGSDGGQCQISQMCGVYLALDMFVQLTHDHGKTNRKEKPRLSTDLGGGNSMNYKSIHWYISFLGGFSARHRPHLHVLAIFVRILASFSCHCRHINAPHHSCRAIHSNIII